MPQPLRRALLRIVIAALCIAALMACIALLRGEFSDIDWRVSATAILFALCSCLAAAGFTVAKRLPVLAAVAIAAADLSFVLVTIAIWAEIDGETFWRVTGSIAIVALETAHASFVISRMRDDDPPSVQGAGRIAVALAAVSGVMGIAPIAGVTPGDDGWTLYGELLGIVLVGQLLCTALAPLLRRLHRTAECPVIDVPSAPHAADASRLRLARTAATR